MLLLRGRVGDSALTGTIYEEGDQPPQYSGSPDTDAPVVWICDEFYEVDSGGSTQHIGDRELQIAFETPMPRGFDSRDQALMAAADHVRTQFARLGIEPEMVEIEVVEVDEAETGKTTS